MKIQRLFGLPIVVACCVFGVVQAQQPANPKTDPGIIETQPRPYLLDRQIAGSVNQEILKVDFAAIKKNQTADVLLKPYDVIDVSDNGLFPGGVVEILAGIFLGGMRHSVPLPIR